MPVARFQMPDGRIARFEVPEGTSPEQAEQLIQQALPSVVAPPPDKAAPFSLSDTARSAGQSVVGATKSIIEGFGAGSAPAEYLEGVQKSLGEGISPARKAEMQRRQQIEDIANKSGKTFDEVAASLGGVKEAPLTAAVQGVSSSLPTVALGIGAGALGATLGAPVAIAAGVGLGVKYLIGALQGAGEVKGTVYDAVRDGLIAQGVPEEKAKERARESQNYIGENWGTIAGGAGLGAWAGGTGVESELLKKFSKPVAKKIAEQEAAKIAEKEAVKGVVGKAAEKISAATPGFVKAGAKEALPEGIQGGQSKYAENVAKTRAGMDTPAMEGVLGAAARDAAVGALTGSAVNPFAGKEEAAPPAAEPTPTATTEQPAAPTPEAPAAPRSYGQLVREIERLKQEEQTPEIKAEIKALREEATTQTLAMVEEQRAAAAQEAADEEKAKGSAFAAEEPQQVEMNLDGQTAGTQLDLFGNPVQREEARAEAPAAEPEDQTGQMRLPLRRTPEGEPTASGQPEPTISAEDIMMTAIPLRTAAKWVEKNVAGKTLSQVADMVKRDPTLIAGKDPRAQLLKTLLQKEVPTFKEAENVAPIETPATKRVNKPRASEPSVGVPVEPAGVTTPAAAPVAGKPKAPVGRRLVPAGQPAGEGTKPEADKPTALNEAPAKPAVSPTVAKKPEAPAPVVATETVDEAAQRKKEAEEMRLAMEAQDKAYAKGPKPKGVEKVAVAPKPEAEAKPPVAKTAAAVKRSEEEAKADKDWQGVMDRVLALKSPFDILGPRKSEAPANKEPRIGKTEQFGTQGTLFPMSKDNAAREENRKREAYRKATEEVERPTKPKAEEDERQMELAARKKDVPQWSSEIDDEGRTTVYGNDDIALVRVHNPHFGHYVYIGKKRDGTITKSDVDSEMYDSGKYTGSFTDAQIAELRKARSDAVFEESKKAAKNPDGPFTGATSNVVGSDSVDPRYVGYLKALMDSMGLGDVRVFLVHPEDVHAPDAVEKYKLYKEYVSVRTAGDTDTEEGSVRVFGKDFKDFYISFKPGMTENKSVEVISHELGHAIEKIAFNNAPPATKAAIKKEYEAWLLSTKGKTGRELVQMLRNRETADTQMLTVDENKRAEDMRPYWTLFTEWFADNTSRWASTTEKPISITEKFFSAVAQKMRDFVAIITGRKYPPAASVSKFLDSMGPGSADMWMGKPGIPTTSSPASTEASFSVSYNAEQIIDSMGPLDAQQKSALKRLIEGFQDQGDVSLVTKARTQVADVAATVESRLSKEFDGAVRNKLGKLNPMGLFRQAQDYSKLLLEYFQTGTLVKDKDTGLYRSEAGKDTNAPAKVYEALTQWGQKNGYSFERANNLASRILEAVRLDEMRNSNKTQGTSFVIHMKDADIDTLVAEYKADKDLQNLSALMDKPRIALVDQMIKVGRLTAEEGAKWKEVVGYVPFDRIEDFAEKFNKVKKISGKGIAQVGKLPELVGSLNRPVGNVFDNYINTLGWMVGQVTKTDATSNTLRSLEDLGQAKFLGNTTQGKDNTVGAYIDGEMQYYQLPTKYDVMAFKDLNPPKAKWLQGLGAFSNILRTTVTAMPPFALKQVTDDIQRAIMTSGVKSPTALIRMSLTNFPKLAFAELRGIQHPDVKQFGALGLTGEFDFQQGKPAVSLLADLGYKPRGKFKELLHRLEGITRASDLSVRKAIYDQTIKETNDQLLAQTRAREFINFRRRGASDFVGAMVTTIPFFNAYIQGMDVLYRAASGADSSSSVNRAEARKMFWNRAATVLALSTLYAMGKGEDDDYNEMDLRTRDGNWVLGNGIKLPVPTELGALFKVIPERAVEYMRRQGTPEEQEAFEAVRTAAAYIFEQYVGRTVPIPQAAKPLLEAWTNHSFLTGRELEGIHQKGMTPSMRRTSGTSELAIAIAEFSRDTIGVEVSPIMVDNSLRGYLGSTAAMATMVTDGLLNPTRMDRPVHKWALVSNYAYDPVGTRRVSEFYEVREKVGQVNATLNELAKSDINAAAAYYKEHEQELALSSTVNATLEQIEQTRAYRKYLDSKDAAETMSMETRQARLEEVRKYETELVRWLREAKVLVKNQAQ